MEEKVCDEIVSHGEESVVLTDMRGQVCPKCGEQAWDEDSYDRYFRAQDALVMKARNKKERKKSVFHAGDEEARAQTTS